jgi:hypothetical protein
MVVNFVVAIATTCQAVVLVIAGTMAGGRDSGERFRYKTPPSRIDLDL